MWNFEAVINNWWSNHLKHPGSTLLEFAVIFVSTSFKMFQID